MPGAKKLLRYQDNKFKGLQKLLQTKVQGWISSIQLRTIKTTFFAARDGEALYSQQKQDQELTVAQIMNSLLPNSDLN